MDWRLLCVLVILVCHQVAAYPSGAPVAACLSMKPGHQQFGARRGPAPFKIEVSRASYLPNQQINVTLRSIDGTQFKGFFLQARRADFTKNQQELIGRFGVGPGLRTECGQYGAGDGLTHTDRQLKNVVTTTWTAPSTMEGHLVFRATFVKDFSNFWMDQESVVIVDPTARPLPTTTPVPYRGSQTMTPIDISVNGCGEDKGCYRQPPGCNEMTCDYLVTWKDVGDSIDFEMASRSHGWVAVGFSHDTHMGEDSVTECIYDIDTATVRVFNSYNRDDRKYNTRLGPDNKSGLSRMIGYYSEGSIKCAFRRQKRVAVPEMFDLSEKYHIMMARGEAARGSKVRHLCSPARLPPVTPEKVSLLGTSDINGRARYPLVKAHGILMVIAWIFFASVGVLLARYYKPVWANRRILGEKYWFSFHRSCQFTVLVLTIIAFIIIFVHADGYSQMCHLPAKAHPIMGIIITCCVIINPLLNLCRCHPEDEFRPCFNWFHWLFGTVAYVLSTVNIFIGMGMSKADVPYWVSWVMVAFVIFHVIIELSLEIHQCCMYRRNKERKEEFELQRKGDPRLGKKEPEYIGRGFKRTMLYIYVPITAILTFLMVIGIAVG